MEGNHPPQRTSFDLGAIKDDDTNDIQELKVFDDLSPCKAIPPFQGLQATDTIGELGMQRFNSIDEGEHALNN